MKWTKLSCGYSWVSEDNGALSCTISRFQKICRHTVWNKVFVCLLLLVQLRWHTCACRSKCLLVMLQGVASRRSSTLWRERRWLTPSPRRVVPAPPSGVAADRCHVTSQTVTSGGEDATTTLRSQQNLVGHSRTPTSVTGRNCPSAPWPTNTTMPLAARSVYISSASFSGVTCFLIAENTNVRITGMTCSEK